MGGNNEMIKQYFQLLLMGVVHEVLSLLPISMAKLDEFIVGTKQFLDSVILVGD